VFDPALTVLGEIPWATIALLEPSPPIHHGLIRMLSSVFLSFSFFFKSFKKLNVYFRERETDREREREREVGNDSESYICLPTVVKSRGQRR
jgi:hypothetical protein